MPQNCLSHHSEKLLYCSKCLTILVKVWSFHCFHLFWSRTYIIELTVKRLVWLIFIFLYWMASEHKNWKRWFPLNKKTKYQSDEVSIKFCVKCNKNNEEAALNASPVSNGIVVFVWEISKGKYEVGGNLSTNLVFFCCICRPKLD